jgi:sulfite oxidase
MASSTPLELPNSGAKADFPNTKDMPDFPEERRGWKGYIEWEKYPEKKRQAKTILAQYKFPGPPEFQLVPLPKTNPVLEGVRWKQYHYALGATLRDQPDISWKYVQQEKAADFLHVLQFPYNGEPPRSRLVETEMTANQVCRMLSHR